MSGPFKVELKHPDVSKIITDAGKARLLSHLATVARQMLQQKVQTSIRWHNLALTYLRGIDPAVTPDSLKVDSNKAVITLMRPPGAGLDPNMLEQGADRFSLKKGLLNGPAARKNQGQYVDVPFRHGEVGSKPVHMEPMHMTKESFASLVSAAKKVAAGSNAAKRGVTKIGPNIARTAVEEAKGYKTSIYSRMEMSKGADGSSMYRTFRRVSANSKALWEHPGFQRLDLFGKVSEDMAKNINKYAEPMLKLLLGGK